MDTATETGTDAPKTASKRVIQKTEEATGNKIADKITSIGRKNKESRRNLHSTRKRSTNY